MVLREESPEEVMRTLRKKQVVQKAGSKNVLGRGKKYVQWL